MKTHVLLAVFVTALASSASSQSLSLTPLGTVKSGPFRADDPRAAEINAYDATARRIYVVEPESVVVGEWTAGPARSLGSSASVASWCWIYQIPRRRSS